MSEAQTHDAICRDELPNAPLKTLRVKRIGTLCGSAETTYFNRQRPCLELDH
jgi:hypothetical protein